MGRRGKERKKASRVEMAENERHSEMATQPSHTNAPAKRVMSRKVGKSSRAGVSTFAGAGQGEREDEKERQRLTTAESV